MGDGFANFVWFGCGIPNLLNTISSSMYCLIFHFDGYFLFREDNIRVSLVFERRWTVYQNEAAVLVFVAGSPPLIHFIRAYGITDRAHKQY